MIRYFNIRHLSSEDGPGLRTTVLFKGCSLACQWCHNPESISKRRLVQWYESRCVGCEACLSACPHEALTRTPAGIRINRRVCAGCFACVDACPTGAMQGEGFELPPDKLCRELVKDRADFGPDGGVTLSGGEALLQDEAVELLRLLQAEGVQTAVDTCGMLFPEQLERALAYTDVVLYDLKLMDDALHRRFTGQGNGMILKNLGLVAKWAKGRGRLWIRTPVIPGATDTVGNITAIGRRIAAIGCAERWELCAFDNRCTDRYERLGIAWPYANVPLVTRAAMAALLDAAQATGACPDIRCTGVVR